MNNKKITRYLETKSCERYTVLDTVLEKYIDQSLNKLFIKEYSFKIDIFPDMSNKGNYIEFRWICNNIASNILLLDDKIEYTVYNIEDGSKNDLLEENTILLSDYLSFEASIDRIYKEMINHSGFDSNYTGHIKRKRYHMLSNLCLIVSLIFSGVVSIYVIVTQTSLKMDFIWMFLFVILPIIGYVFFKHKSLK